MTLTASPHVDTPATVSRALSFPIDVVVERYAVDNDIPLSVAREHERELKRYLALRALNGDDYGMQGAVDQLWHTFILFTQEYLQFCEHVAGRFLHHTPSITAEDRLAHSVAYEKMLNDYEVVFHEAPPVTIWPRLTTADAPAGCSGCR